MTAVSNTSGLLTALDSASPGEVIELAPGDYDSLTITQVFSAPVTIRSAVPADRGRFASIEWTPAAEHVHVACVHVEGSGRYTVQMAGLGNRLADSIITSHAVGGKAIYMAGATDPEAIGNTVSGGEDNFHISGCTRARIVNNIGTGIMTPEPDSHIDFIQFRRGGEGHRVLGNLFLAATHANTQGIFVDDGVYTDFLAEQNIIGTGMISGIRFGTDSGGSSGAARYNTLINFGSPHTTTRVSVPGPSKHNIECGLSDFASLYQGVPRLGMSIADLRPVAGSRAETEGAAARIMALLDRAPPRQR